jgi:hypothetical protein
METIKSLHGAYSLTKFWVISSLISGFSLIVLPDILRDIINSTDPGSTLWATFFFVLTIFGVCLLPFAIWQHIQRMSFFRWLHDNWESLEGGMIHREGYSVCLDTKPVRYTAVFSIILATVSFESRPYAYEHRTSGIAQILFTLYSGLFGWWYLGGVDGIVSTLKAIHANLSGSSTFTLRELSYK